ncbi:MAG: AI-2E family transporter [Gammaproteobacteria bacterium]
MIAVLNGWVRKYFSDPQAVFLAILLAAGFAVVVGMGYMLAPVLASIVIAYLLEGIVGALQRRHVPRLVGVIAVQILFLGFLLILIFGLIPLLYQQLTQLVHEFPHMIARGQKALLHLPERYPEFFTTQQVQDLIVAVRAEIGSLGQHVVSMSLASVFSVIALLVYLILVPLLVFFFLEDKARILAWTADCLPQERSLLQQVWGDVNAQIGNYVRGKFVEILIVWAATAATLAILGLKYAMLLGALVGFSVLVPYIGAVVVTIPVALVAFSQWGLTSEFAYVMVAYGIVQALDGNVLVPLMFSEVVNLHPIAIIVAVLVFGGVWGFWGVFFAIPLATLVEAVMRAWPRNPPPVAAPAPAPPEGGLV